MGLEDRDWYREMLRKEEEKRKAELFVRQSQKRFPLWRFVIVITLLLWITIFLMFYIVPMAFVGSIFEYANKMLFGEEKKILQTINTNPPAQIVVRSPMVEKPLPENGYLNMFYSKENAVSTFRIIAEPYNNYYVYLVDHFDNPVLKIFVRAGNTVKARVPLGVYELKWTRGGPWYGEDDLFGNKNSFRKALGTLKFSQEETKTGNIIKGNSVDFNKIIGNTPYIKISENDF